MSLLSRLLGFVTPRPERQRGKRPRRNALELLEARLAPAVFNIPNGDIAAFIAAINTSNTNNQADTINLAANGTYNFTAVAEAANGGSGLPSIVPDTAVANTITVNGNGSTLSRATGAPNFRFFRVSGALTAGTLILNDATLTGGAVAAADTGGAVLVSGGVATFDGVTFTNNSAGSGGAVGTDTGGGVLTFTDSTISGNTASSAGAGQGGGVRKQGTAALTFTRSTITGNTADAGGGIWNQGGSVSLTDSSVSDNDAVGATASGGGLFVQGNLTLTNVTIDGNTAVGPNGGVFIQGDLTGTNVAVTNNRSNFATAPGGGIAISGNLQLTNATIHNNRARAGGGGIFVATGSGTNVLRFVTVTGNSGGDFGFATGGGILHNGGVSPLQMANSVVAQNTFEIPQPPTSGADVSGGIASLGFNFIGNGDGAAITGTTTGNQVGTTAAPLDPLLGPLQNNGGSTLTRLPNANSPLIDAGDPAFAPPPDTDQRGTGFPRVAGGRVDIGATEAPPPSADLQVTKDDGRTNVAAGSTVVYTVVVTNAGPSGVTGATFTDDQPAESTDFTWTSVSAGGAAGSAGSGTGGISEALDLPAGATVTYTISVTLDPSFTGAFTNTADIAVPAGVTDPDLANNTATDTDSVIRTTGFVAAGAGAGGAPLVQVFDTRTNALVASFLAFDPRFTGGVRVALADFNGDAFLDYVVAAGPGGGPHVQIISGVDLEPLASFFPYDQRFTGGVNVAVGDVTGDGVPDLITGAGEGGGPHVRVFDGTNLQPLAGPLGSFFAYGLAFRGGVNVAAGDTDGDGRADVITGPGTGGGPHVRVFGAATGAVQREYFPYDLAFRGGVFVTAGDYNGDGLADVITAPGIGGGPHVVVFNSASGLPLREFNAFPPGAAGSAAFTSQSVWLYGARVAVTDFNGDGAPDLVAAPGPGTSPRLNFVDGLTDGITSTLDVFSPAFLGGVYVAGV